MTSSPPRRRSRSTRRLRGCSTADAGPARDRCSRSSPPTTSPRAGRCSSSTTRSCSRAPCAAPRTPTPPCSQLAPDGGEGAIAVSIDGNGRRVACDPYTGTVEAVLECAANLACVGAEPLGLTNCLNFGNPEKPHVAWQLERSVAGMSDALRELGVPVVGGNVSLYNESGDGPIYPTPVVGMVGALPDAAVAPRSGFAAEGHVVALVSAGVEPALPGSELAKLRGDELPLGLPDVDVERRALGARLGALGCARRRVGHRARCVRGRAGGGAGGVLPGGRHRGVSWRCPTLSVAALFGEGAGRFVVAGERSAVEALGERAAVIGTVGGDVARDRGRGLLAHRRAPRSPRRSGRSLPLGRLLAHPGLVQRAGLVHGHHEQRHVADVAEAVGRVRGHDDELIGLQLGHDRRPMSSARGPPAARTSPSTGGCELYRTPGRGASRRTSRCPISGVAVRPRTARRWGSSPVLEI